MAGVSILTDLELKDAIKLTGRVAKELGFKVTREDEDELRLRKGDFTASILLGAFIAYCDFRVYFEVDRKKRVEIELQRNNPWWTGLIGISRVKSAAKKLADEIEAEIEDAGAQVLASENIK